MSLKSAVFAHPFSVLPETVCGEDERVQVNPTTSPPYSSIAFLVITTADNQQFLGTAFEIYLPKVQQRVLVTSGHCVYMHDHGGYASQIQITFPGHPAQTVQSGALRAATAWRLNKSPDDDYGVILLPGQSGGFGWSCVVPDSSLIGATVSVCGYPGDKPRGTLWVTGGPVKSVTGKRIFYLNDSAGGQSGSPVWMWWKGYWTCVGVHSYGGCPNSAPRFTLEFIRDVLEWAGYAWLSKSIQSVQFENVVLRIAGRGVKQPTGPGGGVVNCQYDATEECVFDIISLEMPSSLAVQADVNKIPYAVASRVYDNVFLRMDGNNVTQPSGPGAGVVNCQYGVGPWECFNFVPNGSYFNLGSTSFNNVFLRMDATGVGPSNTPGGVVNCQYTASIFERFSVV